jgi:hypothetical protein
VIKRGDEVSEAVLQARNWANELVRREARGPGDTENAMHRLEARYGIPWRTFWQLRYRKPKDVFVSVYQRLGAAYQAECERQKRLLEHELYITKQIAGPYSAAVVAAEAVAGETEVNQ